MCIRDSLNGSPEGFILASLRPKDLLFHHRDINHMKVVVVHLLAQSFGHCPVALIGVHHSGEDIPVSYTHLDVYKRQRKKKNALTGCRAATARVER